MLVELVEILKQQHAAQLTAAQNEIQLLKSKLFQQSSFASTQPVLPSAQPVLSAPIEAVPPPSTFKGLHFLFFSFLFLFLFDSSLTHSFSFIFSGLSVIYRRDYAKVSDKPASQFGSYGAGNGAI